MYEAFYKFRTKPFSLLPDPEFFFLSTRHKQGLTHLEYGLYNRALFTVLTGEPGTGKTTLLNKILALNSGRFTVGVITSTHPDAGSLLPWVADAFGLDCPGQETAGYFRALTAFLGRSVAAGEQVLLVVDEAHNLTVHMLEGLRLLSNITVGRQSSIQIILAGQPSLRTLLASSDMRQLAQRVAVDYALEPLNEDEARAYVQHRLRVAGGKPDLVTEYACALVYQLSGGNPRLINQLCDLALMYGFGAGVDYITAALLWQAAVDRAHGGILPVVVDPRTLLLDPARLNQESQERVPTPGPVPVSVPQEIQAPMASVHANGSHGDIQPAVGDPRALHLDPARLNQESQGRVPKPGPVPVSVPQDTPAAPAAAVHKNGSHGGILPTVVDPRALLLDPVRLSQESQGRVPKPGPVPVSVSPDTPAPSVAAVRENASHGGILPTVVDPRALLLDPVRLSQESQARAPKPGPVPVSVSPDTPAPSVAAVHKKASSELYREGLGLKQAGLYREALKKFEAAEGDPAYRFKASAQRGICLRTIGKLDDAAVSFRHALSVNGAKVTEILHVRYVLALTLDTMGHLDEAQEQYREIHDADPNFRDITRRIDCDDDSPGFPLSWFKSLRQKWQQFRGTSGSNNRLS